MGTLPGGMKEGGTTKAGLIPGAAAGTASAGIEFVATGGRPTWPGKERGTETGTGTGTAGVIGAVEAAVCAWIEF